MDTHVQQLIAIKGRLPTSEMKNADIASYPAQDAQFVVL